MNDYDESEFRFDLIADNCRYMFDPQEDITAFELATAVQLTIGVMTGDLVEEELMPLSAQIEKYGLHRHFRRLIKGIDFE